MPTVGYTNKDGVAVPGVTTIIGKNLGWNKDALIYWGWSQGKQGLDYKKTKQAAADAGTLAHYLVECYVRGKSPDDRIIADASPENRARALKAFRNFENWTKVVNLRVTVTEVHLISEKYQFGGTPDCVGYVSDTLSMLDWKTSKGIYADHLIQVAAYKILWEENHPNDKIFNFEILRLDKEFGTFSHEHFDPEDLVPAARIFWHLRQLHELRNQLPVK